MTPDYEVRIHVLTRESGMNASMKSIRPLDLR